MLKRAVLAGSVAGAAAGLVMAGVEMVYGWVSDTHSAWDAPLGIWSYVGGISHFGRPGDHVGPIFLGICGHMLNAILVGVVFVALLRGLRNPVVILILGVAYGAGLWALQRYVLLPMKAPEDKLFTTALISPQWVWWIAHVALGATIALVYLLLERRRAAAYADWRARVRVGSARIPRASS